MLLLQVQGAQEVPGDPWVAWEAVEETEEASPHEGPEVPEGTPPEEEMSNTELETGSALIRMYFPWQIGSLLMKSFPFYFGEEEIVLGPLCLEEHNALIALLGVGGLISHLLAASEPSEEGPLKTLGSMCT